MDLSIIILSFNTKDILDNCLKSILKNSKGIDMEIIVVDNHSTDGSPESIRKNFPGVYLIENNKNEGFAKANNQGIKISKGKYILLLNSDTLVEKDAIKEMINFMESRKEVGVVGPQLLNSDRSKQASAGRFPDLFTVFIMLFFEHWQQNRFVRTSFDTLTQTDWIMGAALMIRKNILEKTGLLDEKIFMYYDEVEWCYRIKKAGYKIYFYPKPEIIHLWQGSSQSKREGPILANYKGLVYFYEKHKTKIELLLLKFLLKTKAILALGVGYLTNNSYLKETYEKALNLV